MRLPTGWRRRKASSRNKNKDFIDSFFKNLEKNLKKNRFGRFGNADIYEEDDSLFYEIELPGLNKEDVSVQRREGKLVVAGRVENGAREEERNYISKGRRSGKFRRGFPLPDGEETEEITANFEDGLLKVEVPLVDTKEQGAVEIEIE